LAKTNIRSHNNDKQATECNRHNARSVIVVSSATFPAIIVILNNSRLEATAWLAYHTAALTVGARQARTACLDSPSSNSSHIFPGLRSGRFNAVIDDEG